MKKQPAGLLLALFFSRLCLFPHTVIPRFC